MLTADTKGRRGPGKPASVAFAAKGREGSGFGCVYEAFRPGYHFTAAAYKAVYQVSMIVRSMELDVPVYLHRVHVNPHLAH